MPYPTTYKGYPIHSKFGRAYWMGWHYFLNTPGWSRKPYKGKNCHVHLYHLPPYRHAFWQGYDTAKRAELSGYVVSRRQVNVAYLWKD